MPDWDETEYNQISSDWRHRDNLTWQRFSIMVMIAGVLMAAFGLPELPEWSHIIKALLLAFGAFFSLILTISLTQNLWYQVGSGKALEKLLTGKGNQILKVGRTPSPKDFGIRKRDFIKIVFHDLTGSALLLILCFAITCCLFRLLIKVIFII